MTFEIKNHHSVKSILILLQEVSYRNNQLMWYRVERKEKIGQEGRDGKGGRRERETETESNMMWKLGFVELKVNIISLQLFKNWVRGLKQILIICYFGAPHHRNMKSNSYISARSLCYSNKPYPPFSPLDNNSTNTVFSVGLAGHIFKTQVII